MRSLVLLVLALACTPALAQGEKAPVSMRVANGDTGGSSDVQRIACTPEVMRLCYQHIPNVESIVSCLKTQRRDLSTDCRAVMDGRLR